MRLFNIIYSAGASGLWIFLLVSVIMGGSTGYVSGKAIAQTWRPFWHGIAYALIIALGVRFIHYALFQEVLLSGRNYGIDSLIVIAATTFGYTSTRKRQMQEQYAFLAANSEGGEQKVLE